jgi:hypothetical protein
MRALLLALVLVALAAPDAARAAPRGYQCDDTYCDCDGTQDCRDMRKSGMCQDNRMVCAGSPPICRCVAAMKRVPKNATTPQLNRATK